MVLVVWTLHAGTAHTQIVNTLRGFDDKELGWSGGLAGGVALAEGNTEYFEFELDGKIQYQTARHRWRVIGLNARRTAQGVKTAESRMGHLRHNYRLRPWLASVAFVQGQYDPFLRIESRYLFGGGVRVEVLTRKLWNAAVGATVMRETEKLTASAAHPAAPLSDETTTTNRFSCFVTLYRAEKKGVDIDVWGFYQPVVDDFGDARASGAASVRVEVAGGLYFLASYVVEHDDKPAPGVKKLDQALRSGVGWDF